MRTAEEILRDAIIPVEQNSAKEESQAIEEERLLQFMIWLHTEWAPTITIPFMKDAAKRYYELTRKK